MKAKDYYTKYGAEIIKQWEVDPLNVPILKELMADFYQECIDLNKLRHGQTKGAIQAITREQNEKWNALIRLFEKDGHISPLNWNGFMTYVIATIPDLFPPEPPKITLEQILEAQEAIQRIQAKDKFEKDMIDAAKKLQKVEQSVKEKENFVKERDLKNAKFV